VLHFPPGIKADPLRTDHRHLHTAKPGRFSAKWKMLVHQNCRQRTESKQNIKKIRKQWSNTSKTTRLFISSMQRKGFIEGEATVHTAQG